MGGVLVVCNMAGDVAVGHLRRNVRACMNAGEPSIRNVRKACQSAGAGCVTGLMSHRGTRAHLPYPRLGVRVGAQSMLEVHFDGFL